MEAALIKISTVTLQDGSVTSSVGINQRFKHLIDDGNDIAFVLNIPSNQPCAEIRFLTMPTVLSFRFMLIFYLI